MWVPFSLRLQFRRSCRNLNPSFDDIRWYLEDFLEDGSRAAHVRASRVRDVVRQSGTDLFRAIFAVSRETEELWALAARNLRDTRIEIEATDLETEHIPWEMLQDPA